MMRLQITDVSLQNYFHHGSIYQLPLRDSNYFDADSYIFPSVL